MDLADGNFDIIGIEITDKAKADMFPTASCGPDERVVRIPRKLLIGAKADIPDTV